jgi:peptidoglycan/LPS O-acetylase OafA/YrhL
MVPIGLVIAVFAAADTRGARTGMRSRTAVWLGEISFGFYICQGVVVFYGRRLLGPQLFTGPAGIAVVVGLFCAALVSGWLLFTCVERPIMRRWARRRPPRTDVAAVPEIEPALPSVVAET